MKKKENNCMTKNRKNSFFKNYYMFFILFAVVLIFFMKTTKNGDDIIYSGYLVDRSLKQFLIDRYENWTSRLIIETILVLLCSKVPYTIFCFLNSATYVIMTIILSKIFNKEQNKNINIFLCFLVLLYPLSHIGSAGYMATSINYLLPLTCLFYSIYVVLQIINSEKISKISYIIAIITSLIACNMEQMCIVFVGFLFLAEIFIIINKKSIKKNWYLILLFAISIIELIFIAKCPGNSNRYNKEIKNWYNEFANYGLPSKIYLGIVPTAKDILNQKIIFTTFTLFLMIYTFYKTKNKILRALAVIDFSFFLVIGMLRSLTTSIFPNTNKIYNIINATGINGKLTAMPNLICLAMILFVSFTLIYLLYKVFDNNLIYPLILFGGFVSRLMMGFSPTVFASSSRTSIILYFSALVLSLIIYRELYNSKEIKNENIIECLNYLVIVLAFGQYLDEIFSLL